MTEEQIKQKAENVYIRCFDDDFKYTGVLHALEICAEEVATEATKELQEQLEVKDIQIKELEEQKQYWKDSSFDWRHKFFNKRSVKRLVAKDRQLNRAKELLKRWLQTTQANGCDNINIVADTQNFLKE